MITTSTATFMFNDGAVFITTVTPGCCPQCQRSGMLFINRNGKTLCVFCDGKRLSVAASERPAGDDGASVEQAFHNAIV